ncbi:MAG: phosphoenolpyruvate carboxykinase (GTP), partial [Deltaproteobacteria bacterium]
MAYEGPRYEVEIIDNPDQERLRRLTLEHTPAVKRTAYGNLDKISRNKARMAKYTYVIAPSSEKANYSGNTIEPERATKLIAEQRAYIAQRGRLIQIDGYLGIGEEAVAVRWLYTPEGANIAAMQQILAFPRARVESPEQLAAPFRPHFHIVYTPGFFAEEMPGRQAILVDLEKWTTYIMGPDYFGESKKGALRMLNDWVYQKGGLVLHAGAKAVHLHDRSVTMTIMGLSGTGKTTTTFSKQGERTQPIQDDMVVLWPGGKCTITENGCFAKTFGLSPETEPVIYAGTTDEKAWLENVYLEEDGSADFSKEALTPEEVARWRDILIETGAPPENVAAYIEGKVPFETVVDAHGIPKDGWDFVVWTQNGRSIIPMSAIENAADFDH